MSRHEKLVRPPAAGVSHRIHEMRSFTEDVALGDFDAPIDNSVSVLYYYYATGNAIYRMDPDGGNKTLLYTWSAETTRIGGMAYDHKNDKIYASGIATNKVLMIDSDGGNPTESIAIGNFFVNEGICVNVDADLGYVQGPAGVIKFDLATLANIASIGGVYSEGGNFYSYDLDKIFYQGAGGADPLKHINADGTGDTTLYTLGSIYGVAYDHANAKAFWTNQNGSVIWVDYPTAGVHTEFFNGDANKNGWEMEMGPDGNLYALLSDNTDAAENGIFIFTDLDQATTSHGANADVSFGDTTDRRAFCIQWSGEPSQAGGAPTSAAKTLTNTIPRGAIVVRTYVEVIEGFQGDTTAVAIVGDADDEDRYVQASFDVKSQGVKQTGKPSGNKHHKEPKQPKVKVTAGNAFGNLTGGVMRVSVVYVEP